jgi:hypothetical protein
MILTKYVNINIRSNNIKYYLNNYKCKVGDVISVSVKHLPVHSHSIVDCICQNCNNIKSIEYKSYLKNINNGGIYY